MIVLIPISHSQPQPQQNHNLMTMASSTVTFTHCQKCGVASSPTLKIRACTRCYSVGYCSITCQKADWKDGHKIRCGGSGGSGNSKPTSPVVVNPLRSVNNMSENRIDNASTRVPSDLVYNHPRKEDFPSSRSNSWRNALDDVLSTVELGTNDPIVFFKNEKYVCTYDKYPKAKYHLLLIRRLHDRKDGDLSYVRTLNDLDPDNHLEELREIHSLGKNIASHLQDFHASSNKESSVTIKLGYHALPSLEPLHLHIISSDMDSPCLRTRKHVISFTTPLFFVSPDSLERHLESAFVNPIRVGVREERAKSILDTAPMLCTKCKIQSTTVPDWKRHNEACTAAPSTGTTGKLNSLLGWRSSRLPKKSMDTLSNNDNDTSGNSKKRQNDQSDEEMEDTY